ncbi:MAG: hypothetical protein JWM68_2777 [Verrucomicrobiales bacterium]|nr:hypothetical protein [Verrucomicrobiales bacterium]
MVRDAHLAQDITQAVFVALSQNASDLADRTVLAGWLYRTAQNLAANAVRSDVRRRAREHEAGVMNELLSSDSDSTWDHIAPHLDSALGELNDAERDALLLRYFQRKSAREMAQALGVSDEAAQKRVGRAVERLRELFAKRGVTVGASGLVVILSANAVAASPIGLSTTVTAAAALAGKTFATTATTAIAMTTLQKSLITVALVAAIGTGLYEASRVAEQQKELRALVQRQAPLTGQVDQLTRERDDFARQLTTLRNDNERLHRDTEELLKLRGEVARLRNASHEIASAKGSGHNDPTEIAMRSWLKRVTLLKQRFEQWPGKKTPELSLLAEEDWLKETENRNLETDEDCRQAMGKLRDHAKEKMAALVDKALEEYSKANNEQLPADLSQLKPYLNPPVDSFLDGYEIAKPGTVKVSNRTLTWAMVEKGSYTPGRVPASHREVLADREHDMFIVIYQGGHYRY